MSSTAAAPTSTGTNPADLLAQVATDRAIIEAADVRQMHHAVAWALAHPPTGPGEEAVFLTPGSEHIEPIAGPGCPAVAEFCLAEIGAVLGMSTLAAKRYVGQCLELAHRLPRLHARVCSGHVPVWKARQVAERTIHADLSFDAAAYVDRHCAPYVHNMSTAAVERLIDHVIARFHPDRAALDAERAAERRHVTIEDQQVSYAGTMRIEAELDIPDALDFRDAVSHGAHALSLLGCDLPTNVRRAKAVGDMARTQLALDLNAPTSNDIPTHDNNPADHRVPGLEPDPDQPRAAGGRRVRPAREIVLYAHATLTPNGTLSPYATVEGQGNVLLDQIRQWTRDTQTKVTLRPVIDLNTRQRVNSYAIPDPTREHVTLRDRTCVFPWCTVSARRCDIDHIQPWRDDQTGGPTDTVNLAALCRRHHRAKTHASEGRGWSYTQASPGVFVWTSPHGYRYRRDHRGTTEISADT